MSRKKVLISVIAFTIIVIVLIVVFNIKQKYNKFIINQSNWDSIKESRIENNNLVLEEIRFNDYKLIIDNKNNSLYYSVVNNSQNKFNPNVSYNINNPNAVLVILEDEITEEKIKNNYEFKLMIYDENSYHIYNLKCTNLPILNIDYNESEETNQKSFSMEMYLFDNSANIPNRITISSGKIRMNGKDYLFSLHVLTPGKNKRENKLSILNMNPNSEFELIKYNNNLQKQESSINNKEKIIELFLNNEYKGVYLLEEKIITEPNKKH